jgi:hypothetical protein
VNRKLLAALDCVCGRTREAAPVRAALDELSWSLLDATLGAVSRTALDELSWSLLDATLGAVSRTALDRSARLIGRHEDAMTPAHRRITRAIRDHAGPSVTAAD